MLSHLENRVNVSGLKNKKSSDYLVKRNEAIAIDNIAKTKIIGYKKKNQENKSRTINQQIAYKEITTKQRTIPIIIKIRDSNFTFGRIFLNRLYILYSLINKSFFGRLSVI